MKALILCACICWHPCHWRPYHTANYVVIGPAEHKEMWQVFFGRHVSSNERVSK